MSRPYLIKNSLLPAGALGCVVLLLLLVFTDTPPTWLLAATGIGCAAAAGYALGHAETKQALQSPAAPVTGASQPPQPSPDDNPEYFSVQSWRETMEELTQMQRTTDIWTRYGCFQRVVELALARTWGRCGVSLWCPDESYENLVECVITDEGARKGRPPCMVPLAATNLREVLVTHRPMLAGPTGPTLSVVEQAHELQLRADACVPLLRPYGQPLLVVVQRQGTGPVDRTEEAFGAAVEMVELAWHHLQAINQRQWMVEHDVDSGALRSRKFLEEAQRLARRLQLRDDLFSVAVVTMRGFRGMFAGQSGEWRVLYSLVVRSLRDVLTASEEEFLLGATADDVLVLFLPRKDTFLAEALLKKAMAELEGALRSSTEAALLDVLAVTLQWRVADHREYQGSVQALLDTIYRRLFRQEDQEDTRTHRVTIGAAAEADSA